MGALQFISSGNFIPVNKTLIRVVGLEPAVMLGELASECEYWESCNKLNDGYFYSTIENVENNTLLNGDAQRRALAKLKEMDLLDVQLKGIPAKRHIKLNTLNILALFNLREVVSTEDLVHQQVANIAASSCIKTEQQATPNFNTNNNNNKNNNSNTINSIRIPTPESGGTSKTKNSRRSLIDKDSLVTGLSKKQQTFVNQRSRLLNEYDFSEAIKEGLYQFITMLAQMNAMLAEITLRNQFDMVKNSSLPEAKKVKAIKTTIQRGWKSLEYSLNNDKTSGEYNVMKVTNEIPAMAEAGKRSREHREQFGFDYLKGDEAF